MELASNGPESAIGLPSSRRTRALAALAVVDDLSLVRSLGQKAAYGDGLAPEIRGVLAEACLQRVVRLVDFFYETSLRPRDLSAEDFVADPNAWRASRPPMPGVIASHLAQMVDFVDGDRWQRAAPVRSYRCWPFSSLAGELERLMELFEQQLTSETAGWFVTARREASLVN